MTRHKTKKFTAFLWHRRIGLFALVLVIILAITGIMLNHDSLLKLDKTYIKNSLLLNWYGIQPEGNPVSYRIKHNAKQYIISTWQNKLFFDKKIVTTLDENMHGAISSGQFIVIALDDKIILLSYTGELVEQLSTATSFNHILRLGVKYKRPVIETTDHLYYIADEHILDWDITTGDGIDWSKTFSLDNDEREQLLVAYRGKGLKLERIILDLHSGRIFGAYGIYLMDGAAIALLWLSLSGLWVWGSRRKKMRHKKHFQKHHRKQE